MGGGLDGRAWGVLDGGGAVLAEALVLSDPDELFGQNRTLPIEYRQGKLIEPATETPSDVPEPTADAPGAQQ